MKRYLSAVKYCAAVIGNSSSGIIEVPSFHVPTINIGDRQKGRLMAESVVSCSPSQESIVQALEMVFSQKYRNRISIVSNPYEKSETSKNIVKEINKFLSSNCIDVKKAFYDSN
jgi:GDP/UDP-N,N'-diacetylbacillosamine 2-epimerase (hydrolysing)